MIEFEDLEYSCDQIGNQRYIGYLDNGDELRIEKCWREGYLWEWRVAVPGELYGYATNYRGHIFDTPEESFEDFLECYEPRTWLTREEQDRDNPVFYRCLDCGWEGKSSELDSVTVYEDYGDVSCSRCPRCGSIEYDGMELFVEC